MGYPTRAEEQEILRRMSGGANIPVQPMAHPDEILAAREQIADLYLDDKIADYILDLVRRHARPQGLRRWPTWRR